MDVLRAAEAGGNFERLAYAADDLGFPAISAQYYERVVSGTTHEPIRLAAAYDMWHIAGEPAKANIALRRALELHKTSLDDSDLDGFLTAAQHHDDWGAVTLVYDAMYGDTPPQFELPNIAAAHLIAGTEQAWKIARRVKGADPGCSIGAALRQASGRDADDLTPKALSDQHLADILVGLAHLEPNERYWRGHYLARQNNYADAEGYGERHRLTIEKLPRDLHVRESQQERIDAERRQPAIAHLLPNPTETNMAFGPSSLA